MPHIVIIMSWRDRTGRRGGEEEGEKKEERKRRVEEKMEKERGGGEEGGVGETEGPAPLSSSRSSLPHRISFEFQS